MTPRHWEAYAAGAALVGLGALAGAVFVSGYVVVRLVRLARAAGFDGRSRR